MILKNIPHEEVFRGCTIIGIFFDSWIAERDKIIDMRCCLSGASSSNDYDNRTTGLRAQDVFENYMRKQTQDNPPKGRRDLSTSLEMTILRSGGDEAL